MYSAPQISIITITYNAEKVLEHTLLSVLNQTYNNFEYIIVDGGSKDRTLDIISKYDDERVHWISEPDKGIYDAINKGIKMAKGEWINCMNAGDCFASDDVLEKIFSQEYPPITSFLYSDNYYIEKNGEKTYSKSNHETLSILHQSCIYKKALHSEHGYYIVTPQIIVSDLLFFASVPQEQFFKVKTPISCNTRGGISSNGWCITQALCVKVVFRKLTFLQMLLHMISAHAKLKIPFLRKVL